MALSTASGAEAMELADGTHFDLILLDVSCRFEDGWETFNQFTARDPLQPIVILSSPSNQSMPPFGTGMAGLVEKPLDFTKLFQMIHALLEEAPVDHSPMTGGANFHFVPGAAN